MGRWRKRGPRAWKGYLDRNTIIKSLGFASYKKYLQSALWKSIRIVVLTKHKKCKVCLVADSIQVHHKVYSLGNLNGSSLAGLIAICRSCHRKIEFRGRTKLSPSQANKKMVRLRKKAKS